MMRRNAPLPILITLLFFVSINTTLISCSQDEDLIDLVGLDDPKKPVDKDKDDDGEETDPEGDTTDNVDNGSDFDSTDGLKINKTLCDFLLSAAASNTTVEIGSQMDLKWQTVNIPTGDTLKYTGGEINNGIIKFAGQGVIDGELLNKDLELEGDVQLSSTEYNFFPERWDIVQGTVNS